MPEVLRLFQTAVHPADVDELRRLFADDVAPVFTKVEGCLGIELAVSVDHNAGGLVEGAAVSRWESREAMEEVLDSRAVKEAQVRIFTLLRQEPVVRVYEILS